MLDLQRLVCRKLDIDPVQLHDDAGNRFDVDAIAVRRDRLLTWIACCEDELREARDEATWKRHVVDGGVWNDAPMFGELRDAMQFLIDLMFLATGFDAEQLADVLVRAMENKSKVNLARKASGDDGIARRCPACKRSMDEPTGDGRLARCTPGWCAVYGRTTTREEVV